MQEQLQEAQRLRRQIAELERQLDRVLCMDYARRAPARRMSRSQAKAVFDALEAKANELLPA